MIMFQESNAYPTQLTLHVCHMLYQFLGEVQSE